MRIAILDDHLLVAQALEYQLKSVCPDYEVKVFNKPLDIHPLIHDFDVLLLDIDLGSDNGLDYLKIWRSEGYKGKVLMISGNTSQYTLQEAMQNGANGFIGKDANAGELKGAVDAVIEDQIYLSDSLAKYAGSLIGKPGKFQLSEREIEVIRLLVKGMGYKEIGEHLFISPRTVEAHRNHILEKLQLNNVMELVRFALKNHIA